MAAKPKPEPEIAGLVEVAGLIPYETNSRTHSEAQIEQLKESIRRFGFVGVLGYDERGLMIGHARRQALIEMWEAGEMVMGPGKRHPLPEGRAPAIDISGLSDEERRALIIADNKLALNAGWDDDVLAAELADLAGLEFDMPVIGFDAAELDRILNPPAEDGGGGAQAGAGNLAAEFLIPPFSVLNAREGWWQDRKRQWIGLGIQSEVGRGENLLRMSDTMLEPDPVKRAAMIAERERREESGESVYLKGAATVEITNDLYRKRDGERAARSSWRGTRKGEAMGQDLMRGEGKADARAMTTQQWVKDKIGEDAGLSAGQTGTSIFDPVLCELIYRWFAPKGGRVLDPFSGGSVRGIVAAALGRAYTGIDLRPEQIEANEAQWPGIAERLPAPIEGEALIEPKWIAGDSAEVLCGEIEGGPADLVFSCPPYGDLEVYSDEAADISTMPLAEFDQQYARIIALAVAQLKPDRFACFVVGDYRLKGEGGPYANFVSKTITAFEAAGARLYNEAILITAVGSLPIRMAKQFRSTRKMGKTHQNVLVFCKGDPRRATEALGPVDVSAALEGIEPEDDAPEPQPQAGTDTEGREIEDTKYGERITGLGGEV